LTVIRQGTETVFLKQKGYTSSKPSIKVKFEVNECGISYYV